MRSTRRTGSLVFRGRSGWLAKLFNHCAGMKLLWEAELLVYRKCSMAPRVMCYLRPLRRLKCRTDLKTSSKSKNYDTRNLLSCLALDGENTRSIVHQKDKLFTVLDYARNFGNATKEGLNIRVQFHEWWWNIPSLEREANCLLGRGSRLRRRIRFNSRIVLCKFFFIYLVLEQWDCRHLLSFMHLLTTNWSVFGTWSKLNGRKLLPWLASLICALKTSWMNDIVILVKREKLTSDGDYRLQRINPAWFRINHPNEEALVHLRNGPRQNCMIGIGIGIGWYKPSW